MPFIDLLFLISNALCFITAAVILFKINTNKIFGVYVLVAYLFLNGLTNSFYLLIQYGYLSYVPYLYKIPAPLTFLIGPAAYIYMRATLYSERGFKKWDWIHFVPFIVFTMNYLPFYFMPLAEKSALVNEVIKDITLVYTSQDGFLPESSNIIVRALSSIIYLIAQGTLISRFYKHQTLNSIHFTKIKKWMYVFFRTQFGYWMALLVMYIINGLVVHYGEGSVPDILSNSTLLIMSIFFFVLSAYLLMNPNAMLGLNMVSPSEDRKKPIRGYEGKMFENLNQIVLSKKLYLDPVLTISKLSEATKLSQRNIAIAVSDQDYENYNEYINKLRVQEVCKKLNSEEIKNFSIEAIGESCGFNSKATFYRVFKKVYEVTPTEYLNKLNS